MCTRSQHCEQHSSEEPSPRPNHPDPGHHSLRLRNTLFRALVFIIVATPAHAQSRSATLTAGFAVPIDHHHIGSETKSSPNSVGAALWTEISLPLGGRLSFHSGVEFPLIPFKMIFIHQGSAGYRADIANRDIVVNQLVGIHVGKGRTHAIVLVGGALVYSRRVADLTIPGRLLPSTGLREPDVLRTDVETDVSLALTGGLDVPIQVSERIAITPRVRLRVAPPADYRPHALVGVSPGVGVQFRF
jgi:hypothetical protein